MDLLRQYKFDDWKNKLSGQEYIQSADDGMPSVTEKGAAVFMAVVDILNSCHRCTELSSPGYMREDCRAISKQVRSHKPQVVTVTLELQIGADLVSLSANSTCNAQFIAFAQVPVILDAQLRAIDILRRCISEILGR
jgi:hypothetical protein